MRQRRRFDRKRRRSERQRSAEVASKCCANRDPRHDPERDRGHDDRVEYHRSADTVAPTTTIKPESPDAASVAAIQGVIRDSKISTVRVLRVLIRFRGSGVPTGQHAVMIVCDGAAIETDAASYEQSPLAKSVPPPFVDLLAAIAPGTRVSAFEKPEVYTGVDPLTQRNQWFLAYFGNYSVTAGGFNTYDWQPDLGGLGAYCNGSGGLPGASDPAKPVALPPSVRAIDYGGLLGVMNVPGDRAATTGHVEVGLGLLITEDRSYLAGTSFCGNELMIPQSSVSEVTSFAFRGFRPSYAMFTGNVDQREQMAVALRASCP